MLDAAVSECKACVSVSDDQDYLANCKSPSSSYNTIILITSTVLITLDAGCQQQPPTGTIIGLNDTVFTKTTISSVDPSIEKSDDEKQSTLSVTQIVGIAVGAVVIVLAIAGFLFVRCRRRRNRRLLLGDVKASAMAQKRNRHRTVSTLSFRCQAHLTPRSPAFFPNPSDGTIEEENPYAGPFSALASNPVYPESLRQTLNDSMGLNSFSRSDNKVIPHNIATAIPAIPSNVHYSTSPKAAFFSPTDEPASTTSTKSTAQLLPLRQYNPAEYSDSSPQIGTNPNTVFSSPISGSTASPLISRAWERSTPTWDMPPRSSSRPTGGGAWERVTSGIAAKNRRTSNTGSPVETKQINFNFPPPPTGR